MRTLLHWCAGGGGATAAPPRPTQGALARQCLCVISGGRTYAAATQGASGQCQSSRKTISLADTNAHIH